MKKDIKKIKDDFDELFPIGKTNRSSALLVFLEWEKLFNKEIRKKDGK